MVLWHLLGSLTAPSHSNPEAVSSHSGVTQGLAEQLKNAGPLNADDHIMLQRLSDINFLASVREAYHREAVVVERAMAAAALRERMIKIRISAEAKLRRRLQEKHEKTAREQTSRQRWGKRKHEELKSKLQQSLKKHENRVSCSIAEHIAEGTNAAEQQQEDSATLLREVVKEAAQVAAQRIQEAEEESHRIQEEAAQAAAQEACLERIRQEHCERLAQLEAQRQQETEIRARWEALEHQRQCEERARRAEADARIARVLREAQQRAREAADKARRAKEAEAAAQRAKEARAAALRATQAQVAQRMREDGAFRKVWDAGQRVREAAEAIRRGRDPEVIRRAREAQETASRSEAAARQAQEEATRRAREEEAARRAREEAARRAREEEATRRAHEEEAARRTEGSQHHEFPHQAASHQMQLFCQVYELKWTELKTNASLDHSVAFHEFPFPMFVCPITDLAEISYERVREFLFFYARPGVENKTRKEILKSEILRWHPDRFDTLIASRMRQEDWPKTKQAAGLVARCITRLMAEG